MYLSLIHILIQEHVALTNSEKGKKILENFGEYLPKFKKIIPYDYDRMLKTIVQTVSYTHLDVYKRQSVRNPLRPV